jgi:hypothetical protein
MVCHFLLMVGDAFPAFGARHKITELEERHQPFRFQQQQVEVNVGAIPVHVAALLVVAAPDMPGRHVWAFCGWGFARLSELKFFDQFGGWCGHRFFSTITAAIANRASVLARE